MKKITFITAAMLLSCGSMFAQSFQFVQIIKEDEQGMVLESRDLENNAEITCNEGVWENWSETSEPEWVLYSIESELGLKNLTPNTYPNFIVEQEVVQAPKSGILSLCWGNCSQSNENIIKESPMSGSDKGICSSGNGGFHLNYSLLGVELTDYSTAKVIYRAYDKANRADAAVVTVNYVFNEQTKGISSATNNKTVTVYQKGNVAELIYNFDSAADRQLNIYNVTGKLVASEMLSGANGIQTLQLEKGLYIYSLTENGKVVATHKFIVR